MTTKSTAIEEVRPELRKAFARLPKMKLESAISRALMNGFVKLLSARKAKAGTSITTQDLGDAKARIYTPSERKSDAGLLWIHGGGMVLGSAVMNDSECSAHAAALGIVVVSIEYRLAPKHPYPAAIDDCYAVWRWMRDNAKSIGIDQNRIAIAGQSAGGGLAAALCQRILDRGGTQPAAQCLYYPMLDDRTAVDEEYAVVDHLGWNNRNNFYGWSAYLGVPAGSPSAPPWSVPGRREDLSGLPPAWIGVGDLDLFLSENKAYAASLEQAGVDTDLVVIQGAPHGFDSLVPEAQISRDFVKAAREFLAAKLEI